MKKDLNFYLQKYKYIGLPLGFIVVGICIIFLLIIPGFLSIGDLTRKIAEENKKLSDYNNSAATLKELSETQLAQQQESTLKALPSAKDIQGIYLALINSSARANIILRGFSVKVGDIFQKTAGKKDSTNGVPFITVSVLVSKTDLGSLYEFSRQLSTQSPMNSSIKASLSSGEGTMDVNFYYKPINPDSLKSTVIQPLSKDELSSLQSLINSSQR